MSFANRSDAGRKLAARLKLDGFKNPVLLGIPRGGVEVAAAVAAETGWPWSVIVTRKLRTPSRAELAFGAVSELGEPWLNADVIRMHAIDQSAIDTEIAAQRLECARRQKMLNQLFPAVEFTGRTVIIVDDGVATGATMIAALRLARQNGASTVVCAIPVCPDEMRATLLENCDKLVTLLHPAWFSAVGEFYDEFPQLKDQDMEQLSPKNFKVPHHPTSDYHRGSQPNQTSGDIQR